MRASRHRSGGSLGAALAVAIVLLLLPGTYAKAPAAASTTAGWVPASGPRVAISDTEPGLDVPGARPVAGGVPASLEVLLTFRPSNGSRLSVLLADLSDPASPTYGHYLTGAEYDAEFGAPPAAYFGTVAFLREEGAGPVVPYADRTTLAFFATPTALHAIFDVQETGFRDAAGRPYYAPVGTPTLPASLAGGIAGVEDLSNYSTYGLHTGLGPRTFVPGTSGPSAGPATFRPTPCSSAGGPFSCTTVSGRHYPLYYGNLVPTSDLQVPYATAPVYSASGFPVNTTVATILWVNTIYNGSGSGTLCSGLSSSKYAAPFDPSDVKNYWTYTLPAGEPKPHAFGVPIRDSGGQAPSPGASASCDSGGNEFESTLDLDMVGSMAPGANIYEVYGDNGNTGTTDLAFADILSPNASEGAGMTASVVRALANVSVISNSYGELVYNDTSWYASLRQAEARGITVLGADPDAGANTTSTPSSQAYDTFGTVAVGGTTITLNGTTLARSGEVTWYEGTGSGSGSSGGVAATTTSYLNCGTGASQCFPEPDWQRRSADANGVIRAVGDGRATPDLAAIANNTVISLTYFGTSYPVTCIVTSCGFFIITGDSIATPVEAGVVDTVDHAMTRLGQPWLGFLDPVAYALGQAQYAGNLTGGKQPFFDVTGYHNANFSALPGYDLVTGWGPISAQNWTAYLTPHNVSFTESGLPGGTFWSVTLNGVTRNSTGATIVFAEPFGSYSYQVLKIAGYPVHPAKGTVSMRAGPVSVKIAY